MMEIYSKKVELDLYYQREEISMLRYNNLKTNLMTRKIKWTFKENK